MSQLLTHRASRAMLSVNDTLARKRRRVQLRAKGWVRGMSEMGSAEQALVNDLEPLLSAARPAQRTQINADIALVTRLYDEEETRALDLLDQFMEALARMGLRSNRDEEVAAIHVLQSFVMQHAVNRHFPADASDWFSRSSALTDTRREDDTEPIPPDATSQE